MSAQTPIFRANLIVGLLVVAAMPLAAGNHSQPYAGGTLVFDHKTGNEWWVEVVLSGTSSSSVVKVEAMDTGGSWVALTKRSWGAWANSFHIEPGHQVKFRATSSAGATLESCWFTHPAGVEQCSSAQPFDATFGWPQGNNWWVQIKVDANRPLAGVDARVNAGPWNALKLQSWGEWAGSFHMPTGSKVQFRARATDGAFEIHHLGFIWPDAQPYPPMAQIADMRFENIKGNQHWAQVNVYSNQPLRSVEARINLGNWIPMKIHSWGDWGASLRAPEGSILQFRGTSASNEQLLSGCFRWVSATPAPCPETGTWPKEGSWIVYETHSSNGVPGYYRSTDSAVHLVYRNGVWGGSCTGTTEEGRSDDDGDYQVTYTNFSKNVVMRPLIQPDAAQGGSIALPYIDTCDVASDEGMATADGTHAIKVLGGTKTLAVERGAEPEGNSAFQDFFSYADQANGLALVWDHWRMRSRDMGYVTGTDAPLGTVLTAEQQRAIQGTWPVEGSYVVQTWCRDDATLGYCDSDNWTALRWEYRGGDWVGVSCLGKIDGVEVNEVPTGGPAFGRTAAVDSVFNVDRLTGCDTTTTEVRLRTTEPQGTYASGCCPYSDPVYVEAWVADEASSNATDTSAHWDVESNLMLEIISGDETTFISETDLRLV